MNSWKVTQILSQSVSQNCQRSVFRETNSQRGRVLSKKATKQFTKYKNASCQQKFTQALAARSEDKLDELLADKRNATPPPRLSSEICCYQILEFMSCSIRRNSWMKRRKREMELRNIKSLRYVWLKTTTEKTYAVLGVTPLLKLTFAENFINGDGTNTTEG